MSGNRIKFLSYPPEKVFPSSLYLLPLHLLGGGPNSSHDFSPESSSRWNLSVWWWLVFVWNFLAPIDLKDAYLHDPIYERHQQLLCFDVNYHFMVPPFGLASGHGYSPRF